MLVVVEVSHIELLEDELSGVEREFNINYRGMEILQREICNRVGNIATTLCFLTNHSIEYKAYFSLIN